MNDTSTKNVMKLLIILSLQFKYQTWKQFKHSNFYQQSKRQKVEKISKKN